MAANIIYRGLFFYTIVIAILAFVPSASNDTGAISLQFPNFPNLQEVSSSDPSFFERLVSIVGDIPLVSSLMVIPEFFIYIKLIIEFFASLIGFSLISSLPFWLNAIIFFPIGMFIVYEVFGRYVRGS